MISRARGSPSAVIVAAMGAALGACGLVLGIDDIPPVTGVPDAGPPDARKVDAEDARPDRTVDARPDHAQVDAQMDHGIDVKPDRGIDAPPVGELPKPTGTQTTSVANTNFAVHQLWLGDTPKTAAFTPSASAWATFGYNIDGKVTTDKSTDVCTLAPGALTSAQIDGDNGYDNSFGANIVSLLSVAFAGLSQDLTTRIEDGAFTVLVDTVGLSKSATQTNIGLTTNFYGGSALKPKPTFTLADNWPVDPATLADGRNLANGARTSLSDSYVVGGTWVSGDPTDFVFTVEVGGEPLALIIHEAVATFQHVVDDAGASHALNGTIAGILRPSEIIAAIHTVIGGISGGMYCDLAPVFSNDILTAQDIMMNGTNASGESCDGVSIGIAFTADEIQPPSVVASSSTTDASIPSCPTDGGSQ